MKKEFDIDETVQRISRKSHPVLIFALGSFILVLMNSGRSFLRERAWARRAELSALKDRLDTSNEALSDAASFRDMKVRDLARLKVELSKLTTARRALYEGGLQLQEERRLLEKQWEIVSTYLLVDQDAKRINLMRADQALESYPIAYLPPESFGGESRPLPKETVIVSKERFAHPERGKSEQVNGQLVWEPPQVGTSARANALGEFVMFTRGPLILHGPQKKEDEHKAFAHDCLGLSGPVARRLYQSATIGTRIVIKPPTLSGLLKR
ncbi:MAG: L,D-transpeptidase [Elusimicrobia bacterium]|nr:L,D-transpeptidase [Elusimicrobiota bacterium]